MARGRFLDTTYRPGRATHPHAVFLKIFDKSFTVLNTAQTL